MKSLQEQVKDALLYMLEKASSDLCGNGDEFAIGYFKDDLKEVMDDCDGEES